MCLCHSLEHGVLSQGQHHGSAARRQKELGTGDWAAAGHCPCVPTATALLGLVCQPWSENGGIICRIIPSCRNLSITSVAGTQRLLLAQELTSIREQKSKLSPCFHSLLPKDSRTLHKQKLIIIHTHRQKI